MKLNKQTDQQVFDQLIESLVSVDEIPDGEIPLTERPGRVFHFKNIAGDPVFVAEYVRDSGRIVTIEVSHFTYSEGELTYNSIMASDELARRWHKPLIERSLRQPDLLLLSAIAYHWQKEKSLPLTFEDGSIYSGRAHYRSIASDAALSREAIARYLQMRVEGRPSADANKERALLAFFAANS
ncbi:MAG: hypothetical protein KKD74_13900 [Bacteroidetes bacterium]|nr:hypothetical protein [Bacteroidota bacterium]